MKTITLIFVFLFAALSMSAQSQTVGVSAGLSASNVLYKNPVQNPAEYRTGFLVKVNYEVEVFDYIYIATGVTYQEKGFTNDIGGYLSHIKVNNAHRYLGIPFGVGFQAGEQVFGVYGKFLLQANISALIQHESHVRLFAGQDQYEENYFYQTDHYTPFDFSINPVGRFGYRFSNGLGFFLEGSFSVSINHFLNTTTTPFSNPLNNYAFGATFGIDFRI